MSRKPLSTVAAEQTLTVRMTAHDRALLDAFPAGYRHLAYLQTRIGYTVKRDMPGLKGPEVEALYAKGKAWLAGQPL